MLEGDECEAACNSRGMTTGLTVSATERATLSAPAAIGTSRPVGLTLCAPRAVRCGAWQAAGEVSEREICERGEARRAT